MNFTPGPLIQGTPPPMRQGHPGGPNQVNDNIWAIFAHNLNSGASSINLGSSLGNKGLEIIAVRFRNLIQAPVTILEDPDRAIIQIIPSRHDQGHKEIIHGARDPKVKNTKKAKVARPANAFILYRQHHHPLIKSQNPDMHNNQISITLGAQWRKESETTKARFNTMAKQLKAKHQLEHPDYQYQPRKPSEKKRRMTQRKKAALVEKARPKADLNLDLASAVHGNDVVVNEVTTPVPQLPETMTGNVMLELGDQNLSDQTLLAMLEQYNNAQPQVNNQIRNIILENSTPVIYGEPTEKAQEQKNFYGNFHHFSTDESLSADMEVVMAGKKDYPATPDPDALQAEFDKHQDYLFNAELNRMCHWNEEPVLYQS